jgi:hypothetical protein
VRHRPKPALQRALSAVELRDLLADCDEDAVHLAVVEHVRRRCKRNVFWTHVPNGGHRHIAVGRKLKEMGTRAGVPDLLFLIDGRLHELELKAARGTLSAVQRQVIIEMEAAGAVTALAHGVDKAVEILEGWGVLR